MKVSIGTGPEAPVSTVGGEDYYFTPDGVVIRTEVGGEFVTIGITKKEFKLWTTKIKSLRR